MEEVDDNAQYLKRLDRFSGGEKLELGFLEGEDQEPKIFLIEHGFHFTPTGKIPQVPWSDIRCCTLKSGLTSDFLAAHPTWIDDTLEPVIQQTTYPNLETIVVHLPHRLESLNRCLRTMERIIFPFLDGYDSNGERLGIEIHNNSVRIGPDDEDSRGKEIIICFDKVDVLLNNNERGENNLLSELWDPLMQKIVQQFQSVTEEIILQYTRGALAQTFETICSVSCPRLHIFNQDLAGFSILTLVQALKGNRKRKRQQKQKPPKYLKALGFYYVTMNYADFMSLCKMMEENQSIEELFIKNLALDNLPSTISELVDDSWLGFLTQNKTLQYLYFTDSDNSNNDNHDGEGPNEAEVGAALQGLQAHLYEILKNHNEKLGYCFIEGVVGDVPQEGVVDKIQERLDLNYLCLTPMMDHGQSPCTAKVVGESLAKAAEKEMLEKFDDDTDWEPPCLLSYLFRVFQAHPVLVELIPTRD